MMRREQVIDNSVRATRAFVKQYLSDTITRAQSSIASYGAQYSERMFAALTTCQQGELPPSLSESGIHVWFKPQCLAVSDGPSR